MKTKLFLSLYLILCTLYFPYSASSQPFNCDGRLYFFRADSASGNNHLSYFSNYTTVATVTDQCVFAPTQHNALGANPTDMYLYYLQATNLKRIDAACNTTVICSGMTSSLAGDFDITGRYWTVVSNALVAYDISTCAIVKGPFPVAGTIYDLAFNVFDCNFYLATLSTIIIVDTSGTILSTNAASFVPAGTYGGIAIGTDGQLYGIAGMPAAGNLSSINLTSLTSVNVLNIDPGPTYAQSDMASFACNTVVAGFNFFVNCFEVTFTDTSTGNPANWFWDFGDGDTSTAENPVHIYANSGVYTVTLTASNFAQACNMNAQNTYTAIVYIPPCALQILSSPGDTICVGDCANIQAISMGGMPPYTYAWSNGLPNAPGPFTVCPTATTVYTVTVTDSVGNFVSDSILVYVLPAAVAPVITQSGDTLFSSQGYISYQWYFGNDTIAGATNYFYVATQSGNYNVSVMEESGCSVGAGIVNVIAGTNEFGVWSSEFEVSPNPFKDKITFHFLSSQNEKAEVKIYNSIGEIIWKENLVVKPGANSLSFGEGWGEAVYFLTIQIHQRTDSTGRTEKKFYRQKMVKY